MTDDLDRALEAEEIDNFYRLFLARRAEPGAADAHRGAGAARMPERFVESAEFIELIERPLLAGAPVSVDPAVRAGLGPLAAWAADTLIAEPERRAAARGSGSWYALLATTLAETGVLAAERRDRLVAALRGRDQDRARLDLAGALETCDAHGVSGWAVNLVAPCERLTLEIFADGRFIAAARTGGVRRDVQALYGGEGRFGFVTTFEISPDRDGRPLAIEVREAMTGQTLGRRIIPGDAQPRLDGWTAVRRELAQVRAALARIEKLVPDMRALSSFSPASYADYWRRFYDLPTRAAAGPPGGPLFSIVLPADGDIGALARCLASAAAQTRGDWTLSAFARADGAGEERRAAFEQAARTREAMELTVFDTGTPLSAMRNAAAAKAKGAFLVFVAGGALAPNALAALAGAVTTNPGAALLFADGDGVERDRSREAHVSPRFLPGFDSELITQWAYLGDLFAIRANLFAELGGFRAEFEAVQDHDLQLRASEAAGADRMIHVPCVLHHRFEEAAPPVEAANLESETARCVAAHLARIGRPGAVEPRRDVLGAATPGGVRVRPRGLAGTTARIIIPTRDRFDLLETCLASLERSRASNQVAFEVVVVDNASDPVTGPSALAALKERWGFQAMAFDGAFNWASINNAAAKGAAAADVLIFLNNDTVVLSPDWCDSLASLAVRPDVGAAGARLLYADGTLQHAGMVIAGDGWPMHEGAGATGSDGGYLARHAMAHQCAAVTGACLATRVKVFTELGGFDATFAVTLNDVDYCARARAAGLKVVYTPDATLYHLEAVSRGYDASAERVARVERERVAFRAKWGEAAMADPFYNPHFERFAPPFSRLAPPPAS